MDPHTFVLMSGGGSSAPPLQPSSADRLTVSGYYFVTPDGALHRRKSITAFTLSKRTAEGRTD